MELRVHLKICEGVRLSLVSRPDPRECVLQWL
jgi:hypothetical protein